ncbi:MAG: XdhC family protein, partial [Kineosporiaceae bacterium]
MRSTASRRSHDVGRSCREVRRPRREGRRSCREGWRPRRGARRRGRQPGGAGRAVPGLRFDRIAALAASGEPFALATVTWRRGPSSGKGGSKAVVHPDGRV